MMRDIVLAWLADNVPPSRLQHILGVEQMAHQMAHHYQLDESKAAQAGLMHDLAKYFKPNQLWEMAVSEGLPLDPVDEKNPHLLHADVSAIVARDRFGVEDEEILQAIANHTLGRPGMSLLSCIIYIADTIEPTRGDTPELEALRQLCWQDLYKTVWFTSDYSLKYLLDKRCLIHPRTIITRNWAMEMASKKLQTTDSSIKVF